ncbi:MAG: SMP-30/gluconolactonase/LRE family protein [Actinobacteria bacterium]|nr:SMP-30/gluconolactonase/LRE family protein [Actinomycetota bacterium]
MTWEVVVAAGAELGERPVWDQLGASLLWVDIHAGRLHRYRPGLGSEVVLELAGSGGPVAVGAAAPRAGGGYVLAAADGFRLTGPDGQPEAGPLRPPGMAADVRFNDGVCDPAGRFWAGTVATDRRPGAGALYHLDADLTITTVLEGVTESNGLGWSPDGTRFYYIDSGEPQPRVRVFGSDRATGELGQSRDLVTFPGGGAVPDGLVVDADGCLWVALWGGAAVHRYSPEGELLAALPVPVAQPSCPAFGGPGLTDLYLTTAWQGMAAEDRSAQPLAGHLLRTRPGAAGQPAPAFAG